MVRTEDGTDLESNFLGIMINGVDSGANGTDSIGVDLVTGSLSGVSPINIGGDTEAKGNVISGNQRNVDINTNALSSAMYIQNNKIGTVFDGTSAAINNGYGIYSDNDGNGNNVYMIILLVATA